MVGTSWPMAPMVWWLLWQCTAQSPGSSAINSICRIWPTAMSVVTSGQRAEGGTVPPSVPVTSNSWPCTWMGWLVMVRLPTRSRTRSPRPATMGSMPGKTRLFHDQMLKSVISFTRGVRLPGSTAKAPSRKATSRCAVAICGCRPRASRRGWVIHRPMRPMAICTISSACGWYMKVPGRRAVNS
ncbi:hypothetical protein ACAN107058_22955 [Paracidovorax anthurii]